jgi:serine/threonine protein phosphatase PrpC
MIITVSRNAKDLESHCNGLVRLANSRGGKDNITVLLIKIEEK